MHLLTFSYYKALFKEYFYNPIPAFLFVVLAVVTYILFRKIDSMKRTEENAKKRKRLKLLTMVLCLVSLVVLFILCRRSDIRGIRIVDYWKDFGTRHDKMETYLHGFIADLLIFIPVGYLIRWQRHTTHWRQMILSLSVIAFGIELLQFVTMHGCIGVSDLVAYHIGGFIGIYLCKLNAHKENGEARSFNEALKTEIDNIKKDGSKWIKGFMLAVTLTVSGLVLWMVHGHRGVDVFDLCVYFVGAITGMIATQNFTMNNTSRSRKRKGRKDSHE